MNTVVTPVLVDVRAVVPRERHALILGTFRELQAGQAMDLLNDHDPRPLYYQFQAELPGGFTWDYLETGPDTWRVRITRLASSPTRASGSCCGGGCGGGA